MFDLAFDLYSECSFECGCLSVRGVHRCWGLHRCSWLLNFESRNETFDL